jgi:uncharacterized PurR-regulated membrane protein YhhQ (DUF165 family)
MGSLLGLHVVIRIFGNNNAREIFASGYILHIFTVFILVSAIVILAISGKLEQRELSTLIAAISGYVLGQLGKVSPPSANHQPDARPANADRGPPPV